MKHLYCWLAIPFILLAAPFGLIAGCIKIGFMWGVETMDNLAAWTIDQQRNR